MLSSTTVVNRRQFVRTCAAIAGAGLTKSLILAEEKKPFGSFIVGAQSYCFRNFDTEQALKRTQELGLTYIEFFQKHAPLNSSPDRIKALLLPPSADEQRLGLINSIPTDTVLLNTELVPASGELVVNLSGALFDVQGKELANAFAQLVWTVTELPEVRQVRFRVDGRAYRAPNADGVEQQGAVTRGDYNGLAPAP